MTSSSTQAPSVAIAGGGLAGLAAGCALSSAGFQVTLFERRPYLGGRASSYQHPGTGEIVDNCQHVLLGCCTNLIDFYRRTGVENQIRWYDTLTFLEPGGRASKIGPSALPAPLHTTPAFWAADCLHFSDKLAISRAIVSLARPASADRGATFMQWLQRHGQTDRAIERFWKPILVSALNEDVDQVSVPYAAQVVRESFLKSPAAGRMGIPTTPLSELYSAGGDYIRARGGGVECRVGVESFQPLDGVVRVASNGQERTFDSLVLAVPFDVLARMLPDSAEARSISQRLAHLKTSPITGIHLWFDRQISDLDHAVLLDRTIQWMFHKSRLIQAREKVRDDGTGSYVELVVSSSKTLVDKPKGEIVDLAVRELGDFFPTVREANLLKSTVIKEVNATFSPGPGVDRYRPRSETAWPRVFLAGDWTATGWPATMEGAVRSGYLAAQALARASGSNSTFLVPDLPATGFMRLFG
jgi:squalene-associated FAD-dependent desaturase